MTEIVGVDMLQSVQGASRYARSYAFLYAAFAESRSAQSNVRDALDCLLPFITAYTRNIAGKQVLPQNVQAFLCKTFGFDIPIYAVESTFKDLAAAGHLSYEPRLRVYTALQKDDTFRIAKEMIETDFDEIEGLLASYASNLGFRDAPPSGDWGHALVNFLKPDQPATPRSTVVLKEVIMDSRDIERRLVASFIQKIWDEQPSRFERIVRIFMGALVEDFISGVSELGAVRGDESLVVFYDTAVLLRSLGCSGSLHRTATSELTRYLQDIGCSVHYLPGNESEVNNIISTILSTKDSGWELEGETADAISRGEVTISDLRMLQNNFVERLARLNIFEFPDTAATDRSRAFQIDERGFAEYLNSEAQRRGGGYGAQNRQNDAGYLAAVMRLRKGANTRDFTRCGFVFVTHNNFLAYASRRFLIKEKQLLPQQCAPILHLSQVATIAWLLKDQKLSPALAGRELLVNCYAAARPSAAWFASFREGIEKAIGDAEGFSREPGNAFVLQAARRIAQEQSLANPHIMRQLNVAEILDNARRQAAEQEAQRLAADQERERVEAENRTRRETETAQAHANALAKAEASARQETATAERERLTRGIAATGEAHARIFVRFMQLLAGGAFLVLFLSDEINLISPGTGLSWVVKVGLAVIGALDVLDLVGFPLVRSQFDKLRSLIAAWQRDRLTRSLSL